MLEVRELTKCYASIPVLKNVSFAARPGEVTGYLGANGSGKTTTFKILTGLIRPTGGEVLYQGERIDKRLVEFKRLLGYVPEEPHLYSHLTGFEYLEMVGQLRLLPETKLKEKVERFLRLFQLWGDRFTPLSAYSKGMKQRILISAALLHNPEIVILDEAFSGLDVNSAMVLRSVIRGLAENGKVVLLSSHVLEVAEKVCSHVIILHSGRVVANDSIARLRDLMRLPNLEEIFSQLTTEQDPAEIAGQVIEAMQA